MRNPLSCVLAAMCFVFALTAPAFASQIHVDLTCTPLPIANQPADRDPVAEIHVLLDAEHGHFKISVQHTTLSGRAFWRTDQYNNVGLRHLGPIEDLSVMSDQWQWRGTSVRNSAVVMIGDIAQINDVFAYRERVLNLRTQANELVVDAQCTAAG